MKIQLHAAQASVALLFVFASAVVCLAQDAPTVKVETQKPTQQGAGTVSVSTEPASNSKVPNPGIEFTKLGGDIARPIPTPAGATSVLQASAPLGTNGSESVLIHVYRRGDALFMDVL